MTVKKLLIILAALLVLLAAFFWFNSYIYEQKQPAAAADYKEAEFIIQGKRVKLGGTAKYFGNDLTTDLNEDGRDDAVFLITDEPGGSGTFYYAVAALATDRGYVGSEALYIGDRIAPQSVEKGEGKLIVVNYADRTFREPFTVPPSVGKSLKLMFDPVAMQFGEVVQDFEGEADPSRMSLGMKTWTWISALYNDETELKPKGSKPFTLKFGTDGKFSATTDCNSMGGSYAADATTISFSNIYSTKMFCEGSQEREFASLLETASGYHFTSKGELILDLKFDSGSAVFK